MLDFSPEIDRLRPHLGDRAADDLIARERREIFSVYPEVRLAAWAGALLVAAAAGIFIKNNFDRLDRVAVAVILGIAAAACYAIALDRRRPAGWPGGVPAAVGAGTAPGQPPGTAAVHRNIVADYVLLLGALLVSADVGYIEQQFDVFGRSGVRHLLLLAIFHGFTAYRFRSKLVLSASLASLAAWLGLEQNVDRAVDLAPRAFLCAAIVIAWRKLNRRPEFHRVLEHFAASVALLGGLMILDDDPLQAALITTVIGALVIVWGFRTRVEAFVLYGFVAALIAALALILKYTRADELVILVAIVLAIPALVLIHRRFQRAEA